ncbi:MAG: hypothetical protein K2G99_02050, partial [Desulfovibrio sp.]|nr:hypothetical protein [Desulfovibrio sp.]
VLAGCPEAAPIAPAPIAPVKEWGYADALRLAATVMQAARLLLAAGAPAAADTALAPAWRCGGVGYIRFGLFDRAAADKAGAEGLALEVRRTWDDGRRVRFDGQVSGPGGAVLLTVHHLEFERAGGPTEATGPQGAGAA